jgi:hypothetical protein
MKGENENEMKRKSMKMNQFNESINIVGENELINKSAASMTMKMKIINKMKAKINNQWKINRQ